MDNEYTKRRRERLEELHVERVIPDQDEREDFYRFKQWVNSNPGPNDVFVKMDHNK